MKKNKVPPENFVPMQKDDKTGHYWGWILVDLNNNSNTWHMEALLHHSNIPPSTYSTEEEKKKIALTLEYCALESGTYELLGPKVQCNMENVERHILVKHGNCVMENIPRSYKELKLYFYEIRL